MKEKNTQNAVVPTKDTRQYKHTPKTPKRLISKIFAFVACLLLLVNIAIPCFADSTNPNVTTTDASLTYQAHPSTPDTFEVMVYKYEAYDQAILTESLETSYKLASGNTSDQSWQVEHAMYTNGNYTYTINRTYYYAPSDSRTYNSRISVAPPTTISSGDANFQRLTWSPFFVYPEEWDKLPYIQFVYSQASYHVMRVVYSYYDVDEQHEYSGTISLPKQTPASAFGIGLGAILTEIGVDDEHDTYINYIQVTLNHYEDAERTLIDYYCPFTGLNVDYHADNINTNTYADYMSKTHIVYQQVVNEGRFANLFDYLGSAIGGFMDTPVFVIGNLNVTFAMIFGTSLSILLIFAFLRFFSGG